MQWKYLYCVPILFWYIVLDELQRKWNYWYWHSKRYYVSRQSTRQHGTLYTGAWYRILGFPTLLQYLCTQNGSEIPDLVGFIAVLARACCRPGVLDICTKYPCPMGNQDPIYDQISNASWLSDRFPSDHSLWPTYLDGFPNSGVASLINKTGFGDISGVHLCWENVNERKPWCNFLVYVLSDLRSDFDSKRFSSRRSSTAFRHYIHEICVCKIDFHHNSQNTQ